MDSRIVLMTGPDLRHRYFVNRLNREFPIECVFIEEVEYPECKPDSSEDRAAWEWFFLRREEYETQAFANSVLLPPKNKPRVMPIPRGEINSGNTLKSLQAQRPDIIILFGAGLIGREISNSFPNRIFNLHVGIPGQYRGSFCNFWPIHDGRLDCLGATLLTIGAGIDTGEIVAQETIEIEEDDTEQTLMGKTLILGVDLTIQTIRQGFGEGWVPLPLERNGKLFLKKDFTPEAVSNVKRMVEGDRLTSLIRAHLQAGA